MRGVYVADQKISALAASKTLVLITAPAAKCIEIIEAHIGTSGTNLTNQQLEACFQRCVVGSAAGATLTPSQEESGDQVSGATVLGNLTAEPTYTANTRIGHQGFTSLGGYFFAPPPEARPIIGPSLLMGLLLVSAPLSADFTVTVTYREIG